MFYLVLTFDNNDEEDATSLDVVSVSSTTQTTQTTRPGQKQTRKSQSDAIIGGNKLDEQLSDDLKNIDEKRKKFSSCVVFFFFLSSKLKIQR